MVGTRHLNADAMAEIEFAIEANGNQAIPFLEVMRICDKHGLITDSMRADWMTEESPAADPVEEDGKR